MEAIYKEMGRRMREIRKNLGLTQEQVSEKVGVEPAYYGQVERATKVPSLPTLVKIAACLKVPVSTLLEQRSAQADEGFAYFNVKGMMEDLSGKEKKFVAGLLKDAVNRLRTHRKKG